MVVTGADAGGVASRLMLCPLDTGAASSFVATHAKLKLLVQFEQ